ncbi:MAG: universal stress protein [Pseudomonadota bacterium]
MYNTVLVPVEPSQVATHQKAIEMATALSAPDARLIAITVIEPVPGYFAAPNDLPDMQMAASKKSLHALEELVGNDKIETKVLHGQAATEILSFSENEGVDCIVIASHQPGFADYFLGSTAARVVRHAHCSVHVMR